MTHRDILIMIPKGCACQGVTIGGYENQVVLPTPQFMQDIGSIGCLTFRDTTCIDRCVAPLVQALWERGVVTTGACCGHNIRDGYIGIYESGSEITDQETMQAIRIEALAALDELRALLAAPYHVVCSNGILCQDRSCAECGGNGATDISFAAPAVERQPVAYVLTRDDDVCYEADDGIVISNTPGDETSLYKWKPVYFDTSPPAPVAVVLPDPLPFAEAEKLTGFPHAMCRGFRLCLEKVKEMNE